MSDYVTTDELIAEIERLRKENAEIRDLADRLVNEVERLTPAPAPAKKSK